MSEYEEIREERWVFDCDWASVDVNNNTLAVEAQDQGIYNISIDSDCEIGHVTENSCIAIIDALKCDIFKLGEDKFYPAYMMYTALDNLADCYCDCTKMCEMYKYLLEVLGKINSGCYGQV